MPTIEAPVIGAEMDDWVNLGGGNSGIIGDPNHTFGFHLGARYVPRTDYSRWRDPKGADGPFTHWDYACAGDFSHRNNEKLRDMHRTVLARLMVGEYPMVCEFIGKPWADRPVYYWARWNTNPDGTFKLLRYTGTGHDHWSHISWYRSRVKQRAYLWREPEMTNAEMKKLAQYMVDYLMNDAETVSRVSGRKVKVGHSILKGNHMYTHGLHEEVAPSLLSGLQGIASDITSIKAEVSQLKDEVQALRTSQ